MKKVLIIITLLISMGLFSCNKTEKNKTMWNKKELLNQTTNYWNVGLNYSDNISAIMYEGQIYNGELTNIFAYLGIPKTPMPDGGYPAIILIHGGLGRAFSDWVKMWTDRGYVAIAPDFDAQMSTPETGLNKIVRNNLGGPKGYGVTAIDFENEKNSWLYQSISNIVIAHNLLRSIDKVNNQKVGITGISWGSYLTAITLGVDDRFAFAMPVYGAGFLDEDYTSGLYSMFAGMDDNMLSEYQKKFDPSAYLKDVKIPTFWVQGVNDFAFSPVQKQKATDLITKTDVFYAYHTNMQHGQEHGSSCPELFAFADSIVNEGNTIIKIIEDIYIETTLSLKSINGVNIQEAYLFWTDSTEYEIRSAQWYRGNATITDNIISVNIPTEAQFFFVEVKDQYGNIVSSKFYKGGI
ncbi:MAG: alpha/beta hydrolase family protein [Acholeplasmatales bacterium]